MSATRTRTRKAATSKTAKTGKAAAAAGKTAKAAPAASKVSKVTRRTDEQHAELARVIPARVAAGETLSAVALDLGMRPNIAHGYIRQAEFDANPSLALKGKNEPELLKRVNAERENVNSEHNSWGWLSTRTGMPEGTLKKKMEAAGYDVSGGNIASARKAARPAKVAGTSGTRAKKSDTSATTAKAARTRKASRKASPTGNPS